MLPLAREQRINDTAFAALGLLDHNQIERFLAQFDLQRRESVAVYSVTRPGFLETLLQRDTSLVVMSPHCH
jgi:hypothetical protein